MTELYPNLISSLSSSLGLKEQGMRELGAAGWGSGFLSSQDMALFLLEDWVELEVAARLLSTSQLECRECGEYGLPTAGMGETNSKTLH